MNFDEVLMRDCEDAMNGQGTNFRNQLFRLIAKADLKNRERLREGFPEEVATYERWYKGDDGAVS